MEAEKPRCQWCLGFDDYVKYHDTEWAVPAYSDEVHFEFLILESAQAGLSWATILKKREGYRKAFADFDYRVVAEFPESHVQELMQDAGIIMVTTGSTNPATTQIGDFIFRMSYTDDFQGRVAARYAVNELGAQNAIIFRQQDDDYSFGLANFFDEEFQNLGGSTVIVDYVANTVDFSAQINDVLGTPADDHAFPQGPSLPRGVTVRRGRLVPRIGGLLLRSRRPAAWRDWARIRG